MKKCFHCKEEKPLSEFHKNKTKKDGYQHVCKPCKSGYYKKAYEDDKQRFLDKNNKRRDDWRQFFSDLKKESKCDRCPENHPSCLDYHHQDPKEKNFTVTSVKHLSCNESNRQKVIDEITKCLILCKNCHSKLHWEDGNYYKNVI